MAETFDPRFDPAYQRGYEAETGMPASTASAERESRPFIGTPPRPTGERMARRAPAERPRVVAPPPEPEPSERTERREHPVGAPAEPAPRLRGNPFIIVLVVLAAVLIVGGAIVITNLDDLYAQVGPGSLPFGVLSALQAIAPMAMTLGLATVIALLFLLALRWRGRADD